MSTYSSCVKTPSVVDVSAVPATTEDARALDVAAPKGDGAANVAALARVTYEGQSGEGARYEPGRSVARATRGRAFDVAHQQSMHEHFRVARIVIGM
jgi:hypothetical protein